MNPSDLKSLLTAVSEGKTSVSEGMDRLRHFPCEDVGIARIDHQRELRQGVPEVIFGESKTSEQIFTIVEKMAERGSNILVTRIDPEKSAPLLEHYPAGRYDQDGRTFTLRQRESSVATRGKVLVVCAGTSDIPVAREATVTARMLGNEVEEIIDIGVAGIHRLFAQTERLQQAAVVIVVAGMEGALPSVIGGLIQAPVIAVPTSVGYGAAFGGVAALLGMLNSCASGVTVVNIDNGFGAAYAATRINRNTPT